MDLNQFCIYVLWKPQYLNQANHKATTILKYPSLTEPQPTDVMFASTSSILTTQPSMRLRLFLIRFYLSPSSDRQWSSKSEARQWGCTADDRINLAIICHESHKKVANLSHLLCLRNQSCSHSFPVSAVTN